MAKDKKVNKKAKSNRNYRLFSDYLNVVKANDSKFINDNRGYFNNSFDYEIYFCFKLIAIADYFDLSLYTKSIFIRRYLEALGIVELFKNENILDLKINYQLFRILAQERKVGANEQAKMKRALMLPESTDFDKFLKSNPSIYLYALVNNYKDFNEILTKVDANLADSYAFYSKIVHNLAIYNEKFIDKELNNRSLILRDAMKKEENNRQSETKKLITDGLEQNIYLNEFLNKFSNFNDNFKNFYNELNKIKENYFSYYLYLFNFNLEYLRDIGVLFFLKEERGAFITVKPYIEKSALFYTALNLNYEQFNTFIEIYFDLSINIISKHFKYSKSDIVDKDIIDKCYEKYSNFKNINRIIFNNKLLENPQNIFSPGFTYSARVDKLFSIIDDDDDRNLYKDIYNKSVVFSHADGYLLHKSDEDYEEEIRYMIRFIFDFLRYIILVIKKVNNNGNKEISKLIINFSKELDGFATDLDNFITKFENKKK